jgi:DNA-binding response OmpR family regulator/signal transduction histidine kinase
VQTAFSSAEGLAAVQDSTVNLILLDIMLPDMSGFDVCLKIKERRPQLPVIMLSARDRQVDIVRGLDCGANDYITKPFSISELLARIRAALRIMLPPVTSVQSQANKETEMRVSNALATDVPSFDYLLQPADVADTVIKQIKSLLNAAHSAIYIWQNGAQKVTREQASVSDPLSQALLQSLDSQWEQELYQELKDQQEPIICQDSYSSSTAICALHNKFGSSVTLVAPIRSNSNLLGALLLFYKSQSAYDVNELNIVTGIVDQLGIVFDCTNLLSQFEQAQKAILEQTQQASELLPTISHELRSPIVTMKGFITALLGNHCRWNDQEREFFLENINESVDQLSWIVENMLEMGQLDKGLKCHKRSTQLLSLVQHALYNLNFHSTHHELVNDISIHLPRVQVDPLKIERVLQNILANSIKFSPPRGRIRIFAWVIEKEIQIGVEDQGIGISSEHLPHIFERFYRADTHKSGVGLGLYIAQQLVYAHGGRIWAESQPDRGTTIYFTLPIDSSTPLPGCTSLVGDSTTIPGQGSFEQRYRPNGHAKILIVDDDAIISSSLEHVMRAEGFETLTTAYGKKAVELIQSQSPDLLLLDLLLPDVDGLNVCEQVRSFSNIPIIVITGRKAEHYQVQALTLWADDYLVKPFSCQELLARVRAVLRRSRVSKDEPPTQVKIGDLEIDSLSCEVKTSQGKIKLTPTEHKLLYYLASNPGRVLTHEQLLTRVWGDECEHQPEYLWVAVSRLRKKIEPNPDQPRYIFTEPSVGYSFKAG